MLAQPWKPFAVAQLGLGLDQLLPALDRALDAQRAYLFRQPRQLLIARLSVGRGFARSWRCCALRKTRRLALDRLVLRWRQLDAADPLAASPELDADDLSHVTPSRYRRATSVGREVYKLAVTSSREGHPDQRMKRLAPLWGHRQVVAGISAKGYQA